MGYGKLFQSGLLIFLMVLLSFYSVVAADSEPNNDIEEAEVISLGQEISGNLDYISDEFDYYNITLVADTDIVASLNGPENADFDLSIFDNEGTKLVGSTLDEDSNEKIVYRPTYDNNYFIGIWAYDGSGQYNLKVDYPETTSKNSYNLIEAVNNGYIEVEISGSYDGPLEEFDLKTEGMFFTAYVLLLP